jgi:hypothetical protein
VLCESSPLCGPVTNEQKKGKKVKNRHKKMHKSSRKQDRSSHKAASIPARFKRELGSVQEAKAKYAGRLNAHAEAMIRAGVLRPSKQQGRQFLLPPTQQDWLAAVDYVHSLTASQDIDEDAGASETGIGAEEEAAASAEEEEEDAMETEEEEEAGGGRSGASEEDAEEQHDEEDEEDEEREEGKETERAVEDLLTGVAGKRKRKPTTFEDFIVGTARGAGRAGRVGGGAGGSGRQTGH